MRASRISIVPLGIALLAVAIHSPGQMSVDSVIALQEAATGAAIGWGPTFFAAILALLGGGEIATSIVVAATAAVTYGAFSREFRLAPANSPLWRKILALLLVLNPVFFFFVGILWKDVMLATCGVATVVLLLELERLKDASLAVRISLSLLALLVLGAAPLLRQQGILISVPLAVALGLAWAGRSSPLRARLVTAMAGVLAAAVASWALGAWSRTVIHPLPNSPTSVGISTVMSYDVVGMMAYAEPGSNSDWSGAPSHVVADARKLYSPERIDTLWHDPEIRGFIDRQSAESLRDMWWSGISSDPLAYLTHRREALGSLLGFGPVSGCLPGYWGVAGPPEFMVALGLREEMDARDRSLGRASNFLDDGIVFRNWAYLAILAVVAFVVVRRGFSRMSPAVASALVAAALYAASFVPTTIACDFRYLYPMVALATLLAVHVLLSPPERARGEES